MKKTKIIFGLIFVAIALTAIIAYFIVRVPSDLSTTIKQAKYPNASSWKTTYQSGGVDGIPMIRACFNTSDSKDSILNYYQSYFSKLGWQTQKTDISVTDDTVHTGDFRVDIKSQNGLYGGVGEYDQTNCKYYLDILK